MKRLRRYINNVMKIIESLAQVKALSTQHEGCDTPRRHQASLSSATRRTYVTHANTRLSFPNGANTFHRGCASPHGTASSDVFRHAVSD